MSGVRQLALALLTLSSEGWRSLEAPEHKMPSSGGRGGEEKEKTGGEDRNKQREKQWTNRKKNILKETLVRFPKS